MYVYIHERLLSWKGVEMDKLKLIKDNVKFIKENLDCFGNKEYNDKFNGVLQGAKGFPRLIIEDMVLDHEKNKKYRHADFIFIKKKDK